MEWIDAMNVDWETTVTILPFPLNRDASSSSSTAATSARNGNKIQGVSLLELDPETVKVQSHRLQSLRNGKQDLLARGGQKLTFLRRAVTGLQDNAAWWEVGTGR